MIAEQQVGQPILVTVRPASGRVFPTYAVVLLAPESTSPAVVPGFETPDAARAHAQKHWPTDRHVSPAEMDAETARRRPARARR